MCIWLFCVLVVVTAAIAVDFIAETMIEKILLWKLFSWCRGSIFIVSLIFFESMRLLPLIDKCVLLLLLLKNGIFNNWRLFISFREI